MTEQSPLAIFDAFVKSFPEDDRRAFESQAILNFVEDPVNIPGGHGVEAYDKFYNVLFTEHLGHKANWFGLIIYLKGLVDSLIWSFLDPENAQYHDHDLDVLHDGNESDEQTFEMIRSDRLAHRLLWSERQEQWRDLKDNGLSFAALEKYRRAESLKHVNENETELPSD